MRLCGKSNARDTTCTDINYELLCGKACVEKVTRGIPPVQISIEVACNARDCTVRLYGKSNARDTTCTDINYEVVWKK